MLRFISIVIIFSIFSTDAISQTIDTLTQELIAIQELGFLPGFAVAIVSDQGVHYQEAFGYRDTESKTPFTVNSLQYIGSISKTLTGISLMKLVEQGKLSLDDPINDFLPQNLHNPFYPEVPITIRHLATHTASFRDPNEYEHAYIFDEKIRLSKDEIPKEFKKLIPMYNANKAMTVEKFIESMMHPFGKHYRKKNFLRKKPGTTYHYSNMGAIIAGYIIELVSGKSYEEYTRELILEPLGMAQSGWFHDEVNMSQFVSLYLSNGKKIPPYSLVAHGDGGMITSVHDLSIYFSEMIKGYKTGESIILDSVSFKTMMDPVFTSEEKDSGIFWTINAKGEYGHSGGDPGIMAYMMFDPETGIGRIVFTNKYDIQGNGINQIVYIWKTLEAYISKMKK